MNVHSSMRILNTVLGKKISLPFKTAMFIKFLVYFRFDVHLPSAKKLGFCFKSIKLDTFHFSFVSIFLYFPPFLPPWNRVIH